MYYDSNLLIPFNNSHNQSTLASVLPKKNYFDISSVLFLLLHIILIVIVIVVVLFLLFQKYLYNVIRL